ncbi:MAG: MerC domain-containing protein [Bdellovibrionales bacterium]
MLRNRLKMRKKLNWDFWGVLVSGLCMVHCIAVPIVILLFPALGMELVPREDLTHVFLFAFILGVAGVAFISGFRVHGKWQPVFWLIAGMIFVIYATFFAHRQLGHMWEPVFAIIGSLFLIRAHILNHRCKKCEREHAHGHHHH